MSAKVTRLLLATVVIAAAVSGILFVSGGSVFAQDTAVTFNLSSSLENNLRLLAGKNVSVTLASGSAITGNIKEVKNGLLHLQKLSGKSFYDALIRTKDICAFEAQVRGF